MAKKLYHCRINMLLVRADGPFTTAELSNISAMMQAVTDAVAKASTGAIRTFVEVEPRLRPPLKSEESEQGASISAKQKADEVSTNKPAKRRRKRGEDA